MSSSTNMNFLFLGSCNPRAFIRAHISLTTVCLKHWTYIYSLSADYSLHGEERLTYFNNCNAIKKAYKGKYLVST